MNSSIQIAEDAEVKAEELPIDRPRKSGFVIKPINKEEAIKLLQSFYDEDPEEQKETFAFLKKAIDEGRRERGERLLFEDYE